MAADEKTASPPIPNIFSVEKNPGRGFLEFIAADKFPIEIKKKKEKNAAITKAQPDKKTDEKKDAAKKSEKKQAAASAKNSPIKRIIFGGESGHYAFGMVFETKNLPQPYRYEFGRNYVIQLALGTISSRVLNQIPQFSSIAITTKSRPTKRQVFSLEIPKSQKLETRQEKALLMYSDPQTLQELSDEERLKQTLFALSGKLTLKPVGDVLPVTVDSDIGKLNFSSQVFRMVLVAKLVTPFNPAKQSLRGSIEFPLYWPADKKAATYLNKVAAASFLNLPTSEASRSVTTKK